MREMLQEALDNPNLPPAERFELLRELDVTNRKSGAYSGFLKSFVAWLDRIAPASSGKPLKLLEIGPGYGGLVEEIAKWAKANGRSFEYHLMDVDPQILQWMAERLRGQGIAAEVHPAGARHLAQFEDDRFDITYSLHVLHHIQPRAVLRAAIADAARVSALGAFMFDLERRFYAPTMSRLWNSLHGVHPVIANDGLLSVLRAHTAREVREICQELELSRHWQVEVRRTLLVPYYSLSLSKR